MTPLAQAIQAHENAAGRPMDDVEAMAIGNALDYTASNVTPFLSQHIAIARAAYAAGIASERERCAGIATDMQGGLSSQQRMACVAICKAIERGNE